MLLRMYCSANNVSQRHHTCHYQVYRPSCAQVHGFWHELETAGNERQRALLRQLNAHLEDLSRAIEVQHFRQSVQPLKEPKHAFCCRC